MRNVSTFARLLTVWITAGMLLLGMAGLAAPPANMKLQAHLVWGTNEHDPAHKPVEPELKKKLNGLPLKWANYYEVSRHEFEVPAGGMKKVSISKQCSIEVKDLGHSRIEVSHFGKGEHVLKRTQTLPRGETFVLGGNAPNATSWFVILKRAE